MDDDMSPLYPRLEGGFEKLFRKFCVDNQFRHSAETYFLEVRGKLQSHNILPSKTKGILETTDELKACISSESIEPGNNTPQGHEQKDLEVPQLNLRLVTPNDNIPGGTGTGGIQEEHEWDASSLFCDYSPSTRAPSVSNFGQVIELSPPRSAVAQTGTGAILMGEQPFEHGRHSFEYAPPSWYSNIDASGNILAYSTKSNPIVDSIPTFDTSIPNQDQLHNASSNPPNTVNKFVTHSMEYPIDSQLQTELDPEGASQVPQSAVADQSAEDAPWAEADAEFIRQFDRQFECFDLAAQICSWALDERFEGDGEARYDYCDEGEGEDDDENGGGDRSRHDDIVMTVVAATPAAAEDSEESEEE